MFNIFTGYAKFGKVTEAEVIEDAAVKADSGRLVHGSFYSQLYNVL
jgi:hypothetical protein